MKRTLLSVFICSALLAGCGGGGGSTQDNSQPWLGEQPGNGGSAGGEGDNGAGGDTPANQAPTVYGVPSGALKAPFGEEGEFQLEISDPEGDVLSIELINAPSWMSLDSDGKVTFRPDRLGKIESIYVTVSDGENTVTSDTFSVDVEEPEYLAYNVKLPSKTAVGDIFSVRFMPAGNAEAFFDATEATSEGAILRLPYPLPESLEEAQVVFTWKHGEYVEFTNWVGKASDIYDALDEKLTLPDSVMSAHVPNSLTSAYYHMLTVVQGEGNQNVVVEEPVLASTLDASIDASEVVELASHYDMAFNGGELFGVNDILSQSLSVRSRDPDDLMNSIAGPVKEIRLANTSLINQRYWQDLLNETRNNLPYPDLKSWSGTWYVSNPVSSGNVGVSAFILSVNDTSEFSISGVTTQNGIEDVQGEQHREDGDAGIYLSIDGVIPEGDVTLSYSGDPVALRESIVSLLGVSYSDANEWVEWIDESGLTEINFHKSASSSLYLKPVSVSPTGNVSVLSSWIVDVSLTEAGDVRQGKVESSSYIMKPMPAQYTDNFEYRQEIYDLIIPLPDENLDLTFAWLDNYDSPLVRERLGVDSFSVSDWAVTYDDSEKLFTFVNENHASGEAVNYRVMITGVAAKAPSQSGDIDYRLYSAKTEIETAGEVFNTGMAELMLYPKSRCENDDRCVPSMLLGIAGDEESENLTGRAIYRDNLAGRAYSQSSMFIPYFMVEYEDLNQSEGEDGDKPDYATSIRSVYLTSDCWGDADYCWAFYGEKERVSFFGNSYYTAWDVGGDLVYPVNINSRRFSWVSNNELSHFDLLENEDDYAESRRWLCSKDINPLEESASEDDYPELCDD